MAARGTALAVLALSVLSACAVSDDEEVGEQEGAWEAESADDETHSTHLWIVDRALEILGRHSSADATASRAFAILNEPACRTNWQQGLLEADYKAEYNNGRRDLPVPASKARVLWAGSTWESHFYDPDTQKNYKGRVTPTAYTEASSHVENARTLGLDSAEGCYEFGLALHYYTDLTQPMHSANFTFKNRPLGLHTALETYAFDVQDRYALDDWSGTPSGEVDAWVIKTARDSKALHEPTMRTISEAYRQSNERHVVGCFRIDAEHFYQRQYVDIGRCWKGNPAVDESVGHSLQEAQSHTAQYIYLVIRDLPGDETAQSSSSQSE